jgi:hypothetical protein
MAMPGNSNLVVAWYETPADTRVDPIQACATAAPATLQLAVVSNATSASPSMGIPATLTMASTSVRPAAMTELQGAGTVLVAAPDAGAVSLWVVSGGQVSGSPVAIAALARARAVSVASATDGSGRIAVVAEIGCAPQTIAMALGTLKGGFGQAITVTKATAGAAVQPTVAWAATEQSWIVGWIATQGGAHALARRFDATGNARGGAIDPSAPAIAVAVSSDATLLAYEPSNGGSFVKVALGCVQ